MSAAAPVQTPRQAAAPVRARAAAFNADYSDVLKLDLSDIPYISPGLHVEGLKPSLLSRFIGLFLGRRA